MVKAAGWGPIQCGLLGAALVLKQCRDKEFCERVESRTASAVRPLGAGRRSFASRAKVRVRRRRNRRRTGKSMDRPANSLRPPSNNRTPGPLDSARTGFYLGFSFFLFLLLWFYDTGFYRDLLACTGFYWVFRVFFSTGCLSGSYIGFLLVYTGFYRLLPGFTGLYRVLLGFPGFFFLLDVYLGPI